MPFFDLLRAQDQTTARREAQTQNSARLAFYRHTHRSTGVGPVRVDTPVMFDVAFLERPHFTQGASVLLAADSAVWQLPVGTAGLWRWVRDPKGHYIGAYIYLEVRMETRSREQMAYPHVEMLHDLLFQGVAYKNLGDAVATEAQLLQPRTVNFGRA